MHEIMGRNELDAGRRRELHLHAHRRPRRRVPGGRRARPGLRPRAAAVRAEIAVPGALPRVIRVLIHYYADEGHERRSTSTSARRARCARTSTARSRRQWAPMALEFAERDPPHPGLPGRRRLRAARGRRAAGLQRVARTRRCPRSSRRSTRALADAQPLPGPDERRAARARCATATACPPRGSRSATARATSCSPPARRCSSRAPSSSTRGRRSSVYPHLAAALGRARDRGPARRRATSTTSTRCSREITAATRLVIVCNPNNPTSTALPLDDDRRVRRARCRATSCVILDEAYCEFNMLEDPDASLDLLERAPEPRAAAHVLQGLRAVRAARRLRAVRLRELPRGASTRSASRSSATPPRRPPRSRRSTTRTRSRAASSATIAERIWARGAGCATLGIEPAESQANFGWFDLPVDDGEEPAASESAVVAGLAERGVLVRGGHGARAAPGALRVTYGTPRRERALPRRARATCCSVARRLALRGPSAPLALALDAMARPTHRASTTAPRDDAPRRLRLRLSPPGDLARRSAGARARVPPDSRPRAERRSEGDPPPSPRSRT